MCRLMIRTKVKNKGSRSSSSDSLARMRELPTTTMSTSSMQNSSFPVQQSSSAPDFGALLNNNPMLSTSNLVGSSSPRFSTNSHSSSRNERFIMTHKSNPDVDDRLLLAVAAMCNNDETQQASYRNSLAMRIKESTSNSSAMQRKTIEAFHRLAQGGGSGNPHLDNLRAAPGIQTMNNNKGEGGPIWGQNNFASLLVRQGGGIGGGGVMQPAQSRGAAIELDDMDDSDMESIFNEEDYAIDPPQLPYICPDDSLASLSEWRAVESSVQEVEATSLAGPTASCPVAADLVQVFHPC